MNKLILILLLLFLISAANAKSIELSTGALTYHVLSDPEAIAKSSNKVTADGRLIANPMVGITYTTNENVFYRSYTAFTGQNSIGRPMEGFMLQEGLEVDNKQVGLAVGGYLQEHKPFVDLGINSYNAGQIGEYDLVPVLGLGLNFKWPMANSYYVKWNNLITPVIINSSVGLGVEF